MERWEPLRDMMSLRDAMERLIQESFLRPAGSILPAMRGAMPLDVVERGDAFEIRASLPGIKPEDVQITVQGDVLTIRGATASEQERKGDRDDDENWILRERRSGSFYRSLTLPAPLDADRAIRAGCVSAGNSQGGDGESEANPSKRHAERPAVSDAIWPAALLDIRPTERADA
jgi:HSP20 family protein